MGFTTNGFSSSSLTDDDGEEKSFDPIGSPKLLSEVFDCELSTPSSCVTKNKDCKIEDTS